LGSEVKGLSLKAKRLKNLLKKSIHFAQK
jgi:hypothetical protein